MRQAHGSPRSAGWGLQAGRLKEEVTAMGREQSGYSPWSSAGFPADLPDSVHGGWGRELTAQQNKL